MLMGTNKPSVTDGTSIRVPALLGNLESDTDSKCHIFLVLSPTKVRGLLYRYGDYNHEYEYTCVEILES